MVPNFPSPLAGEGQDEGNLIEHPFLYPSSSTWMCHNCHSEAKPRNLVFVRCGKDEIPHFVRDDNTRGFEIATQLVRGRESEFTFVEKQFAAIILIGRVKNVGLGLVVLLACFALVGQVMHCDHRLSRKNHKLCR